MKTCFNCKKSERMIPLLHLHYREEDIYICPQCLPVLIHKPASLAEKLPGLENIPPLPGNH